MVLVEIAKALRKLLNFHLDSFHAPQPMRFVESSSKKQGLNSRILDFTCIYSRDRQRHNELNSNPGWGRIPSQRLLLDNLQREKSFRC